MRGAIEYVKKVCREAKRSQLIYLHVHAEHLDTLAWYKKLGFSVFNEEKSYYTNDASGYEMHLEIRYNSQPWNPLR